MAVVGTGLVVPFAVGEGGLVFTAKMSAKSVMAAKVVVPGPVNFSAKAHAKAKMLAALGLPASKTFRLLTAEDSNGDLMEATSTLQKPFVPKNANEEWIMRNLFPTVPF